MRPLIQTVSSSRKDEELLPKLRRALRDREDLFIGILNVAAQNLWAARTFEDVGQYILEIQNNTRSLGTENGHGTSNEPSSKKRKLEGNPLTLDNGDNANPKSHVTSKVIFSVNDISFQMPVRKKLNLEIVQHQDLQSDKGSGTEHTSYSIQGRISSAGTVEFEMSFDNIAQAITLPIPEKAKKQYSFCLIPKPTSPQESVQWTLDDGPLKSWSCDFSSPSLPPTLATFSGPISPGLFEMILNGFLITHNLKRTLISGDVKEFASTLRESHRKTEIAYHVRTHLGSKEGYLYFLGTGIFFGFKKPLQFFSFEQIESVSYTSVLQRTFNLVISYHDNTGNTGAGEDGQEEPKEIEFSLLDQADFQGIDGYIKRHGLLDGSLSKSRKAQTAQKKKQQQKGIPSTNGKNDVDGNGDRDGEGEGEEKSELQKAQEQIEEEEIDEEDEMEEDYDPDAEEDDDGSGSSGSDDDEYEYEYGRGEGKGKGGKGRNLVEEELGSEAEDVEISEDEGDGEDDGDGEEEEEEPEPEPEPQPAMNTKKTSKQQQRDTSAHGVGTASHNAPVRASGGGGGGGGGSGERHPKPIPKYEPDIDDEDQL